MKSLNRVTLLGNLTRDPELQQTTKGIDVCNFSMATERAWKTKDLEEREESEFHRIVAWDKLGALCAEFLRLGSKVYVEGRIASKKYVGNDGIERTSTEIVADNVIFL